MSSNFVLRGGSVLDGTGAPAIAADVAIKGERISAISADRSELDIGPDTHEIDVSGLAVCPGFIDIHTHYDAQVFWDPALSPSCYHGVTSVVAGNCGFSVAPVRQEHHDLIARTLEGVEDMNASTLAAGVPWDFESFPDYLNSVQQHGTGLNFGAYVGHTALRLYVMGDEAYEREATQDELDQMCAVLTEALEAGACGFASSFAVTHRGVDGKPVPSRLASRTEVETLLEAAGKTRRGVVAVAPGEPVGIKDLYDLQPNLGIPITYTALLTFPSGTWRGLMELNRQESAKGVDVWPQVSPRPGTFQMTMSEPFALNPNAEFGKLVGVSHAERLEAYADTAWRQLAQEAFKTQKAMRPRWEVIQIAESRSHPELIDRPVSEVAAERGCHPLDVILDTAIDDNLATRVRTIFANDDPAGVAELLQETHCTIGLSDAGAHVGQLCDAMQATDFLGKWVREKELMPLETAVRKLTGVQADLFNLADRGYLREGAFADVVVFDPETVNPGPTRRVRDFPADEERLTADQPEGMHHVFVNGTPTIGDAVGVATEAGVSAAGGTGGVAANESLPGHILRPSPRN